MLCLPLAIYIRCSTNGFSFKVTDINVFGRFYDVSEFLEDYLHLVLSPSRDCLISQLISCTE